MTQLSQTFSVALVMIVLTINSGAQSNCTLYDNYVHEAGSCVVGGIYRLCEGGDTSYQMCYEEASVCESPSGSIIISISNGCFNF